MSTDEITEPEVEVGSVRDVLLNSETYRDWEKTDATLRARLASVQAQIDKAQEEERVALAKWAVRKFNAINQDEPVPPKPERLDLSHLDEALTDVRIQQRQHAEQKAWAVVAAMEEEGGLEALRARESDDLPGFLPVFEAMVPFLQRAAERATLMREYEQMKAGLSNTTVGAPRVERIVAKPDVGDLLDAARSGRSLLDPAPQPRSERKIERIDSGYGLRQADGAFIGGYVDHDRPAPPPIPRWMEDDHSRGVG